MVSLKTIIILLSSIILISILFYNFNHLKKIENFKNTEYSEFYDVLTSKSIDLEDRCLLAKRKINDKKDGLQISGQVIDAANKFIHENCQKNTRSIKKEVVTEININPKDKNAIHKYYENYCLPTYGELRDTVPFDNYTVEKDEKNIQYFNEVPINKLELTKENCRRIEEYIKNEKMNDSNEIETKPLSITNLYEECLKQFSIQDEKVGAYNYYLSRDGKYYLNNEPLERITLNKENCRIIQDINSKNKLEKDNSQTITLNTLDKDERAIVCKRSNELDLICSVYNKDKIMEYGKNHTIEPFLYKYELEPEKYEYSFLTPTEYNTINKNIGKGNSGLTADNEIELCYRKYLIDKECNGSNNSK
jgi:hypothetical protein